MVPSSSRRLLLLLFISFSCIPCVSGGACSPNPCKNLGFCLPTEDQDSAYACYCISLFYGENCTDVKSDCEHEPCANWGTCISEEVGFSCICMPGFTGHFCDEFKSNCDENPCTNNATCSDTDDGFHCECLQNFIGLSCEVPVSCVHEPCNGGSCEITPTGYLCMDCPLGYQGENCEVEKTSCADDPCMNVEECIAEPGDFECVCLPGYTGRFCEEVVVCSHGPCLNGGQCETHSLGIFGYQCQCASGFHGPHCEALGDNYCSIPRCFYGGTCVLLEEGYECQCVLGHTGQHCEVAAELSAEEIAELHAAMFENENLDTEDMYPEYNENQEVTTQSEGIWIFERLDKPDRTKLTVAVITAILLLTGIIGGCVYCISIERKRIQQQQTAAQELGLDTDFPDPNTITLIGRICKNGCRPSDVDELTGGLHYSRLQTYTPL